MFIEALLLTETLQKLENVTNSNIPQKDFQNNSGAVLVLSHTVSLCNTRLNSNSSTFVDMSGWMEYLTCSDYFLEIKMSVC